MALQSTTLIQQFSEDLLAFMREFKISRTTFSTNALNNPHQIARWLDGAHSPQLSSIDRVYGYMRRYREQQEEENKMCLPLSKWMAKNNLSESAFAKKYKLSQPWVNQITSGARKAGRDMCTYIEDITNGEVTRHQLRPDIYGDPHAK